METYKTLSEKTGLSMTNLRQLQHTGALPEPDGRVGISPYWNTNNPRLVAFIAERAGKKQEASQ